MTEPQPDPDAHRDRALAAAVRRAIDGKTKPIGALGRLETLAEALALAQGALPPRMRSFRLTILAADHGIAAEGVSAYPPSVTAQMVATFLAGGAAASVFARAVGAELRVVDAGVATPVPGAEDRRVGPGTANSRHGPAMTTAELSAARAHGAALGGEETADAVAYGEMGIANSSAAALVAGKILGRDPGALAGRGTGLSDAGRARPGFSATLLSASRGRGTSRP